MVPPNPLQNSQAPLSKMRLRVWLRLLKVSRLIEDDLRRKMRRQQSWSLSCFDLMSVLDRSPEGLRMSDISRRLMVSNGNVTALVDTLTAEGLAQRTGLPGDRRAFQVHLTDFGKAEFAKTAKVHEGWVDDLLAQLNAGSADALLEVLDQVIDDIETRSRGPASGDLKGPDPPKSGS